jgi:NADH-quinone oxidoreductase subunit B
MDSFVKNNLNIFVTGIGCCKQEILSTMGPIYDVSRFGINFVSIPEDADVLVVQGFFNKLGESRLVNIYNRMKSPKWVIAAGKCTVDVSMLDSNYRFTERFKDVIKIDYFIPGCPPRPEAFIYCILRLTGNA